MTPICDELAAKYGIDIDWGQDVAAGDESDDRPGGQPVQLAS
jgi:hypothetical protein